MRFLRTNTAVIVTVGPFYDKTDGVTIETALTITNERITLTADTDAGSAPTNILDNVTGATSGTANDLNYITGNDAGMMQLELAAADVNRLGRMMLSITDAANHVPVFHEFMVLPAMIYDAFVLGTDVLDSSMTQILGTAVSSPATAGILDVNVKNIDNDAASASGTVTFPAATLASTVNITAAAGIAVSSIGNNVITAASINADAITAAKIADGAIDANTFAAGAITAAAIATDAIGAAELAADAVTEIRSLASGTSDSGTTTTMVDAARTEGDDDYWKGAIIVFTSGTIAGQSRLITGFTAATDTVTFAPATTQTVGTQTYEIWPAGRADLGLIAGAAISTSTAQFGVNMVSGSANAITATVVADGTIDAATFAANAITSTVIANDAITDAKVAADVTIASVTGAVGSVTGAVGSVTGAVGSVTGLTASDVGAIKAKTDNLPTDPADQSLIIAATDAIISYLAGGLTLAKGTIGSTGNSTTALHLTGLTYGDDEINKHLLVIRDVSEGEYHARWVEDWANAGDLATVATLPFTPENAVDTYWLLPMRSDVTGGSGLDAAGVRAAVGLASANLDTQLGAIDDLIDTEVAAIKTVVDAVKLKTDLIPADIATALYLVRTGTAQAGAAGTITLDAGASATNDKYNYGVVTITSGTGIGQSRVIEDYDGASKVATITTNWLITPDNTSGFKIDSMFPPSTSSGGATAAEIADAVWDEDATGHQTQGSFGQAIGDPGADTDTIWALANTNLNATVSSRASQTSLDTVDDFLDTEVAAILAAVDTEVGAIKTKTDQLVFTTANRVDAQVFGIQANAITATAINADAITAAKIADGAIDAATFAAGAITAAAIATDAIDADALAADAIAEINATVDTAIADVGLTTTITGRIDAAITTRASQTSVDTIDDFLDTEVGLILAAVDTEVAAIKAVTDLFVTAHAEPTGTPAANATPLVKLAWLFMALRNQVDVTASKKQFYDDGGSVEWEKDLSDDGTTFTESEANAP